MTVAANTTPRIGHRILRALDHPRAPHVILAVGLVLRLIALAVQHDLPLDGDARSYYLSGRAIIIGAPFEPDWPPGLPAYLALGYAIFGVSLLVGRALMIPVYLGFCAALFGLTRRISGQRAANLALALFAVSPAAVWNSTVPLTQLPAAALTLGVVYYADRCARKERLGAPAILLGVTLAALILTRPSNLLLAALPLYIAYKSRRWQVFAIPTLILTLALGSWTAFTRVKTGHWVLINNANSQNIYYGNNPWTPLYRTWWFGSHKDIKDPSVPPDFLKELLRIYRTPMAERDKVFTREAMAHIKARPDLFVIRTVNRVRTFFGFDTFTGAQVAKMNRIGGAAVLLLDVACYLALMVPLLFLPAAWSALQKTLRADPDHPHPLEVVRVLAVALLLSAAPYFIAFSHPTFHLPFVALASTVSVGVLVILLEGGIRPLWAPLGRRGRIGIAVAVIAFFATQAEWAVHVASRANQ